MYSLIVIDFPVLLRVLQLRFNLFRLPMHAFLNVEKQAWRRLSQNLLTKYGSFQPTKTLHTCCRYSDRSLLGVRIMRPDAKLAHFWLLIITLVDFTYTAFLVPISMAFDSTNVFTWLTIANIVGSEFHFYFCDGCLVVYTF
jgi:hypothetical protein